MGLVTQSSTQTFASKLAPFTGVNNGTARLLKAITANELATLRAGDVVYTESFRDYWKWLPTDTTTSDDVTYCAPTVVGVGAGRFERLMISSPDWMLQTTWVFSSTGNDENSGLDAANALLTTEERRRRMGGEAVWQANTAYHFHYLTDSYTELFEGYTGGANSTVYLHATMTYGAGDLFFSGVATTFTAQNTATNTRQQITSASVPVSWTASNLLNKRLRMTSGAANGAFAWVVKDIGGAAPNATAALTTMLIPAASLNVTPFSIPAVTVANGANGDTFVVETLRTMTRVHCRLTPAPGSSPAATRFIFDSIIVNISDAPAQRLYFYGCGIVSVQGNSQTAIYRVCQVVGNAIFDLGGKFVQGGYCTTNCNFFARADNGISTIEWWTCQGSQFVIFGGFPGQNGENWRLGQFGIWDNSATLGSIIVKSVGRLGTSTTTLFWGNGNAGPIFLFQPQGVIIVARSAGFLSGMPFVTAFAAPFAVTEGGVITGTALGAYDPATGLFTAPRTMTFANLEATVAAGGFNYHIIDQLASSVVWS